MHTRFIMRLKHSIMDRQPRKMFLLCSSDNSANSKCRLTTISNYMRVPLTSMLYTSVNPFSFWILAISHVT